jgi:hypothetical protein
MRSTEKGAIISTHATFAFYWDCRKYIKVAIVNTSAEKKSADILDRGIAGVKGVNDV